MNSLKGSEVSKGKDICEGFKEGNMRKGLVNRKTMGPAERLWKCTLQMEPCREKEAVPNAKSKQKAPVSVADKRRFSIAEGRSINEVGDTEYWREVEPDKYKLFYMDIGESFMQVEEILRLLDRSTYPKPREMEQTKNYQSQYTATLSNLDKLGLKVILNRIALIISADELINGIYKEPQSIKVIPEKLKEYIATTDETFSEQLGHLSGCVTIYKEHILVMLEGPELSILDVLRQLKAFYADLGAPVKGCVLFVMTHVVMRYLNDWVVMWSSDAHEDEYFKPEKGDDGSVEMTRGHLAELGAKCRLLWSQVKKARKAVIDEKTKRGKSNQANDNPPVEIPSESSLAWAVKLTILRPLDPWLKGIFHLTEDSYPQWPEWGWPTPKFPYPTTAHLTEGRSARPPNWDWPITESVETFLTEERPQRLEFDAEGQWATVVERGESDHRQTDKDQSLVDQPSLMQLLDEKKVEGK